MTVKYKFTYEHGDADMVTTGSLIVPNVSMHSRECDLILRELAQLKDSIATMRSSGSNAHLPNTLIDDGFVELIPGVLFFPELDQWYDQRNLYASIDQIEVVSLD